MRNKLVAFILTFFLSPLLAWGEEAVFIDLSIYKEGYTITENNKTYHFTGTFTGTPNQDGYKSGKAVISIGNNITTTIILDNVNISLTGEGQCPLYATNALKVTLNLIGDNILSTTHYNGNSSGIFTPEINNNEFIIQNAPYKNGSLTLQGESGYSGIDGFKYKSKIIINSGIINSIGGRQAAGIRNIKKENGSDELIINGGIITAIGNQSSAGIGGIGNDIGGICTITGGIVNAIGGTYGAGIGGGFQGHGGSCTITGGIVTATGTIGAAGIGGGYSGNSGTCTITGGTVIATGGFDSKSNVTGAGIGKGIYNNETVTFSTTKDGIPGNAFIVTTSISDNATDKKSGWSGVIFEGDKGEVYGSPTLKTDAVVPNGKTLEIGSDKTLVVGENSSNNVTLVNEGIITNSGTLTNNGTILKISGSTTPENLSGTVADGYKVTYNSNYDSDPIEAIGYVTNNGKPEYNGFSNMYHTFDDWYDAASDGNKVESISEDKTVYAHWKKNELKAKSSIDNISGKFGVSIEKYSLSNLLDADNSYNKNIGYTWNNDSEEHYGLSISKTDIIGTPNKLTASDTKLKVKIHSSGCKDPITVEVPITIDKGDASIANLTIPSSPVYTGKAIEITAPEVKDASGTKITDTTLKYYTTYTDKSTNTPTTAENSGASGDGQAPAYAGTYTVVAGFAGNENYEATNKTASFTINKSELTVTPNSNQVVYEDDKILYTVTGKPTNGAEPKFEGALKADKGKVVEGDFKLDDTSARNYSIKFSSDVSITAYTGKAEDAVATIQATDGQNGWYKGDITLTSPADFQIALVSSTSSAVFKDSPQYADKIVWTTEGEHTITYSLKRKSNSNTYQHPVSIKLDKTAPTLSTTTNKLSYTLTFGDKTADGGNGSGIDKLFIDGNEVTPTSAGTTYTATGTAGDHTAKVTDKAGWSTEIEFTLKDDTPVDPDTPVNPDKPVEPDQPIEPDPEPVYYDVTLPETAGVIFSPVAGTYSVAESGSFSFTVTVAEGYREQSVPVVKANGAAIAPSDADGRYKIKFIRSDQTVTVEGIIADTPTTNEAVTVPAFDLYTEGHTLCITAPKPSLCRLFDPSGRLICTRRLTPGINRLERLAAGIYFVVVESEGVRKIIIME